MSMRKVIYIKIICIALCKYSGISIRRHKSLYKYSKLPLRGSITPLRSIGINHLILCSMDEFEENKPVLNVSEKAERKMIMA